MVSPVDLGEDLRTIETNQSGEAHRSSPGAASFNDSGLVHEELVGGRFRIKELIQSGGMGDVYRALDLQTKESVALKTLRSDVASPERFRREAARLAELKHPGIPRYITHDVSANGRPFLVMEWLEGMDLASFLRERAVGPKTAVELMIQICAAVGEAHRRGIVHRDLNPSNIFLLGGDPKQVKVLDFGVARLQSEEQPLTVEGTQIGTPGYMSPEQVDGRTDVGAPADIFSLGCIFYEVIGGQRAFYAPTVRELLARIVSEDPVSLTELHAGVTPELAKLVSAMLAKDPAARPADAENLRALLIALPELDDAPPSLAMESRPGSGVQQVTSLIVLRAEDESIFARAVQAAEPHGLKVRRGTDETIVIATQGRGTAGDHAATAARCALAVQRATRVNQIALSTGLSQQTGEALSGRAFDTALVSLLLKDSDAVEGSGPCLWLDENTAALLDSRFEVRATEQGFLLRGVRTTYEPARTVLGRRTRCVGRKRELSMLAATLTESFEDSVASSVLVTGPPGSGKSRLASEATKSARRTIHGIQILRGGAESITAGAPFSAMSQAIQQACRMRDSEPDSIRRNKLQEHLTGILPADELQRVSEFLSELLGICSQKVASPQLQAARRDAVLKGDQIVRALEDWLRAECKASPVLLILDDFHWGDLATVKFIDAALRNLAECPFVVLTLARPEVHDLFPKLWVKRGVTELRLGGLSRRAATEMIQEVMGQGVAKEVIERVISRAQGNPFWIEELLRAEDAGHGESVPDRMVLLAQSRIEQQSADERRLLEAASVFGRQFWLGGASDVLFHDRLTRPLEAVARDLVEGEFIVEREMSRLGGEQEFEFASGLLRDAAYSLLDEQEREEAHSRAAAWLERNGESDPLAIAMHFSLGGEGDRARPHYLAAAEQALAGDDLEAAISCAEEGLGAGATGPDAVRLRLVHAEASKWRGDNAIAFKSAQAAFARAEDGTSEWYRAAAEAAVAAGKIGKKESSVALAKELMEGAKPNGADPERGIALARVASQMALMGNRQLAQSLVDAVDDGDRRVEPDPRLMGFVSEARALIAGGSEDPLGRIEHAEQAASHFEHAGDLRNACLARLSLGFAEVEFGATHDAVITLEEALRVAERMGLENSVPVAQAQLARALGRLGEVERARELLSSATGSFDRQRNVRLSGMSRLYLAELCAFEGELSQARQAAQRAEGILEPLPPMLRIAQGHLAALCAELGEAEQAVYWAERAIEGLMPTSRLPVGETMVRLGAAAGLIAGGRNEAAIELLEDELGRLERLARELPGERREQFWKGTPCRAYLSSVDFQGLASGEGLFFFRSLGADEGRGRMSIELEGQETTTVAEVHAIVAEKQPVIRNLRITQSYHVLSREISRVVDQQNVNWSTFACWASKTAGISIRNDELPNLARDELGLGKAEIRQLTGLASGILKFSGLARLVQQEAVGTLREVSEQIALGNQKVYEELAPLFARFVDLMRRDPSEASVAEFVSGLNDGPIEEGGQELLKSAFTTWHRASLLEQPAERAELILRANCQIGLHEQTRLQRHIQGAMDAPIAVILRRRLKNELPAFIGGALAALASFLAKPLLAELTSFWERVVTRHAMNLVLPGGKEISLGEDIPNRPDTFPADLRELRDSETRKLVARFDERLDSSEGCGANNWADLQDRMGFIVELFRSRQQDLKLFDPPFTEEQLVELEAGRVPRGRL